MLDRGDGLLPARASLEPEVSQVAGFNRSRKTDAQGTHDSCHTPLGKVTDCRKYRLVIPPSGSSKLAVVQANSFASFQNLDPCCTCKDRHHLTSCQAHPG